MSKLFLGMMGAAALAFSSDAAASVTINFTGTTAVPGNNDFKPQLNGLGLTQLTSTDASIILNGGATLTFYYLGAESAYNDTFTAGTGPGPVSLTETANANNFASPVFIGSKSFASGDLAGLLNFTSNLGKAAGIGDDGFGIFLGPNAWSGMTANEFYLGYDDQIYRPDDDYDDFVVRVTVTDAVPEPATWAMMLLGFGAVGFAMRRGRSRMGAAQAA